jgi:hypothetical protein
MPSSPNINSDAPATFAAYAELATKTDAGTTVPDNDLDTTPGASLFNFYDTLHEQTNAVFRGTRYAYAPWVRDFFGQWTDASKQYLDPHNTTENSTVSFTEQIVAPANGWIAAGFLRVNVAGGSTNVWPNVNGSDGTVQNIASATTGTTHKVTFGTSYTFTKGDLIAFAVDPTTASSPGEVIFTAVLMLDFTTM